MKSEGDSADPLLRAIGNELMAWRKQRGMTQEELALAAGMSKRTLSRYENGEVRELAPTVEIARILEVDLSFIVSRAESAVAKGAIDRRQSDGSSGT